MTSKRLTDKLYLYDGERKISNKAIDETSTNVVPAGNVIVSTRVTVGKAMVNKIDIAINQDLTGLIFNKSNYLPEFIAYQLKTNRIQDLFSSQKRGATIKGVTREDLKRIFLFCPSLLEQQKIADVLFLIQSAVETQAKIIQKTIDLKKALFQKLFIEGIKGERKKETELGMLPQSWSLCDFTQALVKSGVSKKNQINASQIKVSGAYPVIDQGQSFIAGYCDEKNRVINSISPLVIFGDHTRCLKYVDFPFVLGADGTQVLAPDIKRFNPRFFYYYLCSLSIPNRGYNRHFKLLKENKIPCPSLDEQQKISDIFHTFDEKIRISSKKKENMQHLFDSMLFNLMTAQIRVMDLSL